MLFFCHFFFFNDTATTEIYTLPLHDALPISEGRRAPAGGWPGDARSSDLMVVGLDLGSGDRARRSEEHTSELQSQSNLVCRLLLEKKKKAVRLRSPPLHHVFVRQYAPADMHG